MKQLNSPSNKQPRVEEKGTLRLGAPKGYWKKILENPTLKQTYAMASSKKEANTVILKPIVQGLAKLTIDTKIQGLRVFGSTEVKDKSGNVLFQDIYDGDSKGMYMSPDETKKYLKAVIKSRQ